MTEKYLYKYMPYSDHKDRPDWVTEIVKENKIFVPSAKQLNDPFELIFEMNASGESPVADQLNDLMDWKLFKDKIGIISFSKNPLNLLMWSHYGHGHKGLCLKFLIKNRLAYNNFFKETIYSNKIRKYEENEIFWTKATDWSYEQEVRYITTKYCQRHVSFEEIGLQLEEIILGPNISSDDAINIISSVKIYDKPYNVRCAEILKNSYQLTFSELSFEEIRAKYIKLKALQKISEKYK
jgi:hypothetical protein